MAGRILKNKIPSIILIILLLLVLVFVIVSIYKVYSRNTIEGFDSKNFEKCTLTQFNSIFDSDMKHLPGTLIAYGVNSGKKYMYIEDLSSHDGFKNYGKLFIEYWEEYIHKKVNKNRYYFVLNITDGYREGFQYYNKNLIEYIPELTEFKNVPELKCDYTKTPILHKNKYIFSFSKHNTDVNTIAVINPYFIACKGFRGDFKCGGYKNDMLNIIDTSFVQWKNKKNNCIWRGMMIGANHNFFSPGDKDELGPRQYLKKLYDDKKLHAKMDMESNVLSPVEQLENKYILNIDGAATTADAIIWKLYSGSVTLIQHSFWVQYGYENLKEWVHYVPVANDFSDLNEKIEWCLNNDDECEQISLRARKFIEVEMEFNYVNEKFSNYIINYV